MFAGVVSLVIMKASKGLGSIVSKLLQKKEVTVADGLRIYSNCDDGWRRAD